MKLQLDHIRMIVGFSIISSHLLTFGLILFSPAMEIKEKQELSLLLTPIFSVYIVAVVKRFLENSSWDKTRAHPSFALLSIGAGLLFSISGPMLISQFGSTAISTFAELKTYVGIVESVLGLYTGLVVDKLFGSPAQAS